MSAPRISPTLEMQERHVKAKKVVAYMGVAKVALAEMQRRLFNTIMEIARRKSVG